MSDGEASMDTQIRELLDRQDWPAAVTAILQAYGSELLRYLRGVLHDDEQAREVFSAMSERLWRSLPSFRREASARTWAYRLAWCAAVDHRRRAARQREERLSTADNSKLGRSIHATTSSLQSEVLARLARIRASLEPQERSLLHLRVERGLPWREVADIMGEDGVRLGEAALRKRFERLRRKVRNLAADHGLRGRARD